MSIGKSFHEIHQAGHAMQGYPPKSGRYMIGRLVDGHPDFETDVDIEGIRGVVSAVVPADEIWGLPYLGHNLATDPRTKHLVPDEAATRSLMASDIAAFAAIREEVEIDLTATEYLPLRGVVSRKLWPNPGVPVHSANLLGILDISSQEIIYQEYLAIRKAAGIRPNKPVDGSKPPLSRMTILQVVGPEKLLRDGVVRKELLRIVKPAIGRWTLTAVGRHKMPTND